MKQIAAVLSERITRVSFVSAALGVVYLWFGILKFFPGLSPAEELAGTTIERLTLGILDPAMGVFLLAIWVVGMPFGLTLVGQYIFKNLVFLGVMVILIKREVPK